MKRIIVESLSKHFILGYKRSGNILEKILSLVINRRLDEIGGARRIQVTDDVSFEALAGETIGIIGRNGSGKSTLLRLIAGIYQSDSGLVRTEGSMIYLSGFGQGLQQKLTMRENIYLMGSLMGLSQDEIKVVFDDIVAFSGLADFVDARVYQFSSGMLTRLNFSVTIHCVKHKNPDILLLDEVLGSGGDIDFQARALSKMEECIRGGATVILVSHSLDIISRYCSRVMWLDHGKMVAFGPALEIVERYVTTASKNK